MPPCKADDNLLLLQGFIVAIIISAAIVAIIGTHLQNTPPTKSNDGSMEDIITTDADKFLDHKGNYTAILGYNVTIIGLLSSLVIILAINKQCNISLGFIQGIIYYLPIIATIGTMIYISALYSKYQDKLSNQLVNLDFYSYSTTFAIFSTIQLLLICRYIQSLAKDPGSIGLSFFNIGVMILSAYNYFVLGKMYKVLKYFSTDG